MMLTALGGIVPVTAGAARMSAPCAADAALDRALARFVRLPDGPPGIAVVMQRGGRAVLHRAGTGDVATGAPIRALDSMRLASVSKAYSGAVALSLVAHGILALRETVRHVLPGLPRTWSRVTLRELMQHTSGIVDFIDTAAFKHAVQKSPFKAPAPRVLVSFVPRKLLFRPGSKYHYSNTDNILVGLMAAAATGQSYVRELRRRVFVPLGLRHTSLPRGAALPAPYVHGYDVARSHPPADISHPFAAGWAWASGGMVSTPRDVNAFIRGYVRGATTSPAVRRAQFTFRPGSSGPPGPGVNSAGLSIFRYQTRCGTVYGHTGNTAGFTQFVAASENGRRSVVVSINAQITPTMHANRFPQLRRIDALAVCAALAH